MAKNLLLALISLAFAAAQPISAREWTNSSGKKIEAEYVSSDATSVRLKRPDGKFVRVLRDQLSAEDSNWLKLQPQPSGDPPAAPATAASGPADERATALEALGAKVERDLKTPGNPIVSVDMHGLQIMDGHLALLKDLDSLKRLDLSGCNITAGDTGLANIASLTNLEALTFFDSRVGSDGWLTPLANLTNLKALNIDPPLHRLCPTIHDSAMSNLKQLVKLERLRMSGWEITDKSMPYLEQMTNLRELELMFTGITNAGIANLKRFPHLRRLWIRNQEFIDDDGMQVLGELPELEFLILSGDKITGAALKHLRAPQLRELGFEGNSFGDEVFEHLQAIPSLEHVHFLRTRITDRGLPALDKLTKLKSIEILNCSTNGPGLMELKSLKELRKLQFAGSPLIPPPSGTEIEPDTLKCLQYFPLLETLKFNRTHVGNRGVSYLKHVPRLKNLQLSSADIDDEGLVHLQSLKELESLNLSFNNAVGSGLAHLKGMKKLEQLVIPYRVTDEGLAHISELKELRELDLANSRITDQAMPLLAKLTKLETLSLMDSPDITDKGLESLAALTKLRDLRLMNPKIGDPAIAHLVKLQELRELRLILTKVSGAGVDQLAALPNLRTLWVSDPDYDAVRRLQERNPRVTVYAHAELVLLRGERWQTPNARRRR